MTAEKSAPERAEELRHLLNRALNDASNGRGQSAPEVAATECVDSLVRYLETARDGEEAGLLRTFANALREFGAVEPKHPGVILQIARDELGKIAGSNANSNGPMRPKDVLKLWADEGPLVHERTGFDRLDELTGGGPVYGSRWFLQGAPDAGKTLLLIHICHELALRGIAVGILAVDEEPSDMMTRFVQRAGWSRRACEQRFAHDLREMGEALGELPVLFFDGSYSIEDAAQALADFAKERGLKAMLAIDSLQTVECREEKLAEREIGMAEAVTKRAKAVRAVATKHRLIAMATSEMGRAAYSGAKGAEVSDMAAAKWSGAIEYQARVQLTLRSVAGESDLVSLKVTKNKHGPSGEEVFMRLDRRQQGLEVAEYTASAAEDSRIAEKEARAKARTTADAAVMATILARHPGLTARDIRAHGKAEGDLSRARADATLARLGVAVVRVHGARCAVHHYLDGQAVTLDILGALGPIDRDAVTSSRVPSEPTPEAAE